MKHIIWVALAIITFELGYIAAPDHEIVGYFDLPACTYNQYPCVEIGAVNMGHI